MSQSLLFEVFFPITPEEAQEWVEKSQSLLFEVFFPITGKILVELFVLEESQSLLFEVFFPIVFVFSGYDDYPVAIPSF